MVFPSARLLPAVAFAMREFIALLLILSAHDADAASEAKAATPKRSAAAAPAAKSSPLDTATIRRYYLDGDFDPAIDLLETTLNYKSGFTHEDSIFLFKHLGVMYAAKYETREKGKQYMLRLLEVEPTARIMDMYASDMIYMIFKNIQDEFDAAHRRLARADTVLGGGQGAAGRPKQDSLPARPPKKGNPTAVWMGAGATIAVAAGVAAWYYFSGEPKTAFRNHEPD